MIGSAFVLDATLISVPGLVIRRLSSDFWMAFLLGFAYGLASVALMAIVSSRYPRMDFFEGIARRHPLLGKLVVAGYAFFFFGILVRDIRSTIDFIKVALLTLTPLPIIWFCMALCTVAIARHGRLVVGRMSQLWQPLLIILVLFLPLLLSGALTYENLLPAFRHDAVAVLDASLPLYPYMGEAIGVFMIASYRSWTLRYSLLSFLLGWVLITLLTFTVVLSIGTEIPARTIYPNYEMIRKVRLTDFLDRLDLPMVGIWLPAMIVKTSFGLYIASHGLVRIVPKLSLLWSAIGVSLAAGAVSLLLFQSQVELFAFQQGWIPVSLVFQIAIPAALLLLMRKRRRPKAEAAPRGDALE